MGFIDDWCSKRGFKARREGMYKDEKKWRKWAILVFFIVSAVIFCIFGALHAERAANAGRINKDFEGSFRTARLEDDSIAAFFGATE